MDDKIESMIKTAAESGSVNLLNSIEVRDWVSEYLDVHHEEVDRFPALIGKPHLDVLMADGDLSRPALFVVALFTDDTATFAVGRGASSEVRGFLEREASMDTLQLIPELAARFQMSQARISVSRAELSKWLG